MQALSTFIDNFHFLRPLFLLGLIPAVLLVATLGFLHSRNSSWHRAIDKSLLPFLLEDDTRFRQFLPLYGLLSIWVLSTIALAGPTWQQIPAPVQEREDALVIVQDLSLSMYSTDLNPSRLVRAQRKLIDLLNSRDEEGQTALVVYAGSAHTVTPLTDDIATINNMVPALDPNIMPVLGSNPEAGVSQAITLLENAQLTDASILLVTDGINRADINAISEIINNTQHQLLILGVGTEEGAPIPTEDGFLRDQNNSIVIPRLNRELLEDLAAAVGGRYTDAVLTDEDIDFLLSRGIFEDNQNLRDVDQDFDTWAEAGPWLLLLVLPLAALAFRRGWLLGLAMLFLINPQQQAMALSWQDLWLNKDQQGSRAFDSAEFDSAAQLFEDQDWRASSHYRSGDYEAALAELNQMEGPQAEYNRGNTLARLQRYEEALAAYDQVLDQQPDHTDAQANRQIVQNLLEQQQQQEQENQEQQQDDQGQDQQQSDDQQQGESEQQEQQSAQENQQEQQQEESDEAPQEQQQSEVTDSDAGQEDENQDEQPEPEQTLADQGESEEEQAMQQWLGRIEDNPGELLRNKFRYQTQQLLYEQLQNPRIFENPNQEQIW
tara:strand:+ start:103047 stop:104858 length:1812 start_codon:yes stop_codon:yes gene_type:complete